MALFYLNSGSSEYSAVGEPFSHGQGWYLPLHLAHGPVQLTLPMWVTVLPSPSGARTQPKHQQHFGFQLFLHVVSLTALVGIVACFTQILVFFFTKEKPHHSLSWLGRQGVSSLELFEASVTAQILNPFIYYVSRKSCCFWDCRKISCKLILWFCMFAASKLAVSRNNIVYKIYLFHLALIFLFTYPKLNVKKEIISCGFSLSCSKSDLYLYLCY